MSINGKTIVITGASSGIGRAAAKLLATRGANVVLGAKRNGELEAVAQETTAAGGHAAHRTTNVTRRQDVEALVALAAERFRAT